MDELGDLASNRCRQPTRLGCVLRGPSGRRDCGTVPNGEEFLGTGAAAMHTDEVVDHTVVVGFCR
jgi:hypothetical protein